MTNLELENLIRDLINESLNTAECSAPGKHDPKEKKLLVVEVESGDYERYSETVKEALNSEYDVRLIGCSEALNSEKQIPLLITALPLNVQAKAVVGIADCPLSRLLQDCFVNGRDILILKSSLDALSDIASFNYRKLFSGYQRRLSEYGLRIVEINQLVNPGHKSSVLIAADIKNLSPGSSLDIDKDCLISYAATEIIRDKKLKITRK